MTEPTMLCALLSGRPEHTPDVEMILVHRDGERTILTLPDGTTLDFDAVELRSHVSDARPAVVRAA